jgi:hypothetical protein
MSCSTWEVHIARKPKSSPAEADLVLKEIARHMYKWDKFGWFLRIMHTLLGLVAIVSSIVIAARISTLDPHILEWLALSSAISVGLQTGFDLGEKANRFRRAWRILKVSYFSYEKNIHGIDQLIKDYDRAEEMVGDVAGTVR